MPGDARQKWARSRPKRESSVHRDRLPHCAGWVAIRRHARARVGLGPWLCRSRRPGSGVHRAGRAGCVPERSAPGGSTRSTPTGGGCSWSASTSRTVRRGRGRGRAWRPVHEPAADRPARHVPTRLGRGGRGTDLLGEDTPTSTYCAQSLGGVGGARGPGNLRHPQPARSQAERLPANLGRDGARQAQRRCRSLVPV